MTNPVVILTIKEQLKKYLLEIVIDETSLKIYGSSNGMSVLSNVKWNNTINEELISRLQEHYSLPDGYVWQNGYSTEMAQPPVIEHTVNI